MKVVLVKIRRLTGNWSRLLMTFKLVVETILGYFSVTIVWTSPHEEFIIARRFNGPLEQICV